VCVETQRGVGEVRKVRRKVERRREDEIWKERERREKEESEERRGRVALNYYRVYKKGNKQTFWKKHFTVIHCFLPT